MESASAAVLRTFGLHCTRTAKHKAGFTCVTDKGVVALVRVPYAPDRIWFRYYVKEHLHASGFPAVRRMALAVDGQPFALCDGEAYIILPHKPCREADFSNRAELLRVVQTVARMHMLCRDANYGDAIQPPAENPRDIYNQNSAALAGYKRRVTKKGKYAEMDMLFLRSFSAHEDTLAEWLSLMEQPACAALAAEARNRRFLCHGRLKEENILILPQNEITLTNLADCDFGHGLLDLAALVKRYIKALPDNPVALADIAEAYDAVCPLADGAAAYLRAALLFPDKYLKLCARYYERNRTWTPAAFTSRMEALLAVREAALAYIDDSLPAS